MYRENSSFRRKCARRDFQSHTHHYTTLETARGFLRKGERERKKSLNFPRCRECNIPVAAAQSCAISRRAIDRRDFSFRPLHFLSFLFIRLSLYVILLPYTGGIVSQCNSRVECVGERLPRYRARVAEKKCITRTISQQEIGVREVSERASDFARSFFFLL